MTAVPLKAVLLEVTGRAFGQGIHGTGGHRLHTIVLPALALALVVLQPIMGGIFIGGQLFRAMSAEAL
ncbi:hypothetical protein F4561_000356 [Lipingzhangella halophila]|uniref:Uncharacterized protein n=1 Tax=Lipingzhangella halophila TaxID=1783352 RepID=A0A7W7W0E3_9ACTN|nr:hypothetical protein [Lipingzhangella halophila]MBB4929536.1 hypothetical protein [Lipingzhangella halophila]